jgi:peptide deformylase
MEILEISKIPNLSNVKKTPLENPVKILRLCQELQKICETKNVISASIIQVGIPWNIFVIKGDGSCPFLPKDKYRYFIECDYEPIDENFSISLESCLSIKSNDNLLKSFEVKRFNLVKIFGYILDVDKQIDFKKIDFSVGIDQQGAVFQHEIDHYKKGLISEIGKEVFLWK